MRRGTIDYDPSGQIVGANDFSYGPEGPPPRRPDYIRAATPEELEAQREQVAAKAKAEVAKLPEEERQAVRSAMDRKEDKPAAVAPPWEAPTAQDEPAAEGPGEDPGESYTEEDGSFRCCCGFLASSLAGLRAHQRSRTHREALEAKDEG
jgi:hypothetical protein